MNIQYRAFVENSTKGIWLYGFYANRQSTTYCCKEDYEKFPVETCHYLVVETMTDWGLPNSFRFIKINPNTLGQNTNMKDIKEKDIFVGDIVKYTDDFDDSIIRAEVCFGEYMQDGSGGEYESVKCCGFYFKVIEANNPVWIDDENYRYYKYRRSISILDNYISNIEIIGNIYEGEK